MPKQSSLRRMAVERFAPVLIVSGGATAFALVQWAGLSFTGQATRDLRWILILTCAGYYLWVRRFSRLGGRCQLVVLAGFLSFMLALAAAFRIDGFRGDGRPIWVWRWSPSHEARWREASHAADSRTRAAVLRADLSQVTWRDWPAFRAADRSAVVEHVSWASDDHSRPRLLWRRAVGGGWSSFVVRGNGCVTQEQRGPHEAVVCYNLQTGAETWVHHDVARFEEVTGGPGPRATPTIDGGRVYALGATGILNCLDGAQGAVMWSVNVLGDHNLSNRIFGMAGSPLVVGERVIVSPGGRGTSLVAYDCRTGNEVWAGGDSDASYSSPQLAEFSIGRQVLSFHADGLSGHDLETGRELWVFPWVSNPEERNNVCQPVPLPSDGRGAPDRVFISSGYGRGAALLELRVVDGECRVRDVWQSRQLRSKFASVVRLGHVVFGLDDSILTCLDLTTGQRRWKQGRYGHGQLLLAGNVIVVQAESGEVAFVASDLDRYRELYRFQALDDRTWNQPVLAGDLLLVRNDREAVCYRLSISAKVGDDSDLAPVSR